MSIHPSLKISAEDTKSRSVLKRSERLKLLMEKEAWKEGQSIFGLPKVKTLKLKIKKEKAAPAAAGEEGTPEAKAAAAPAPAEGKKEKPASAGEKPAKT